MKSYKTIFRFAILLAIGIVLLLLAFRGQDLDSLVNDLKKADYGWVMVSVLAGFLAHGMRAVRWKMMISSLGHGSPSLITTFQAVMIGYLANLVFPRMGEVSRCGVINKTDGIPLVKLIGTVIAERITDLLFLTILIALVIFFQFKLISGFIYNNILIKLTGRTGDIVFLLFALFILILGLFLLYILIKRKKWGITARLYFLFNEMKTGILSVKNLEDKPGFIFSSIMIWFFYWLSGYLCFFALESTSGLGPMTGLAALVFGSLAMTAPVQGGIGAFHWMTSEALKIYDIHKSDGLAYALLTHTSQTLLVIFAGALSLFLLMMRSYKNQENEQAR